MKQAGQPQRTFHGGSLRGRANVTYCYTKRIQQGSKKKCNLKTLWLLYHSILQGLGSSGLEHMVVSQAQTSLFTISYTAENLIWIPLTIPAVLLHHPKNLWNMGPKRRKSTKFVLIKIAKIKTMEECTISLQFLNQKLILNYIFQFWKVILEAFLNDRECWILLSHMRQIVICEYGLYK